VHHISSDIGKTKRRKNVRRPIPRRTTRRPRRPALRNGIRRLQGIADVRREPSDDIWRGTFVVVDMGLGPSCEGDAGFQGVELGC
jgi:hypothetical protein